MAKVARWIIAYWECPKPCYYVHERSNKRCGSCGTRRPRKPRAEGK